MKSKKRPHPIFLLTFFVLMIPAIISAGVPVVEIEKVFITDVTTVSFSVIWPTS